MRKNTDLTAALHALHGPKWHDVDGKEKEVRKRNAALLVSASPPELSEVDLSFAQKVRVYTTIAARRTPARAGTTLPPDAPRTPAPAPVSVPGERRVQPHTDQPLPRKRVRFSDRVVLPPYPENTGAALDIISTWAIANAGTSFPDHDLSGLRDVQWHAKAWNARTSKKRGMWRHIARSGCEWPPGYHITLRTDLLTPDTWAGICRTAVHEVAHHLTATSMCTSKPSVHDRKKPHGREWRAIFKAMGGDGATHGCNTD
jgi:hypothetical protein